MPITTTAQPRPPGQLTSPGQMPPDNRGRSGLRGVVGLARAGVRTVVRSWTTTPGRLTLIATGLVILTLLTGLTAAVMAQQKTDAVSELTNRREPLTAAAGQVYRALSDADATASSSFLSTGDEPPALRVRFINDIAQAGVFLARAASDPEAGPEISRQIDIIGEYLPIYAELVGTARANNQQGFPAGAAYLREASQLMQSTILPAAEALYEADTRALADRQAEARGFPWLTALLVTGLLAALIATQLYLKRRTKRVFNIGLVVATAAIVVGMLWSSAALITQSVLISSSETNGSEQVDRLVRARIAGLKARVDETLLLVSRGEGQQYAEEFTRMSEEMAGKDGRGGLLAEARAAAEGHDALAATLDKAQEHAAAWLKAHAKVRDLDDEGEYLEAASVAIDDTREDSSARAFNKLDIELNTAIQHGRQNFFDDASDAGAALTLLPWGWIVLGFVAAGGVAVGIQERLREYR
ncbi:MAG: hypothetical protein DIU77_012085 [Thermocrispum agreste]|uniref:Secreted protein n=2 Tax=Thermocrispum agreste TaxID=37925 RepID=A0ABD6FHN6_9PSEU